MLVKDFCFELPKELIAQNPPEERGTCRLLVVDRRTGEWKDSRMESFVDFLDPDSVMVVNDTKVRKARVYGLSESGGRVEFLFTADNGDGTYTAMTSKSVRQRVGKTYSFSDLEGNFYCEGRIAAVLPDGRRVVAFDRPVDEDFFVRCGHVPLPPYIRREDAKMDEERYQTVYAANSGSVAAPTAGLHFTPQILEKIRAKGIPIIPLTLHVGMGTFIPMRGETLEEHKMHVESYHVPEESARAINEAKAAGRKIVAVGTTSVRTLESAWDPETRSLRSGWGRTGLFIKPGFVFHLVDQLLTNFHTPESTLLVLVSAFAGRENIIRAYNHAVQERYRFFSYGDATFLK